MELALCEARGSRGGLLLNLGALLLVFRPVGLLTDFIAVVGIPAAVEVSLIQTVATLQGECT